MKFETLMHPLLYGLVRERLGWLLLATALMITLTALLVAKELKKK